MLIDVLTTRGTNLPMFVVNISDPNGWVPLLQPVGNPGRLYNQNDGHVIQKGDSFVLLSYGFFLPWGFEVHNISNIGAYNPPLVRFGYIDDGIFGVPKPVPNMNFLSFPLGGNYEISHGGFFDFGKTIVQDNYELTIQTSDDTPPEPPLLPLIPIRISMYNVPADLDGKWIIVPFFIKIAHTLSMIAG